MNEYDVIVVGLGAMGSAASYQIAKAGAKVLGIDRYEPPHTYGSTHGDTRITRLAVGEGAEYVPLVTRSHQLWREIEQETGYELLDQCGGLIMSAHSSQGPHGTKDFLKQTIISAKKYGIRHAELSKEQVETRFPQFNSVGIENAYFEHDAGFLRPERCVRAQLELAKKYRAVIKTGETTVSFEDKSSSVVVKTNKATYTADKLIVSVGPWVNELVNGYEGVFKVYRQVLYWFELKDKSAYEGYRKLPVFIWSFGSNHNDFFYGFPAIDGPEGGLKVATAEYTVDTTPNEPKREVSQHEIDHMYERHIKDRLPGLTNKCVKAVSCFYTTTPNHQFVIDHHPMHRNVIVASPCSGHGFKHSAAIGEVLSQLAATGNSNIDVGKFSFSRLLNQQS